MGRELESQEARIMGVLSLSIVGLVLLWRSAIAPLW